MHGMSIITVVYLSFYTIMLLIAGLYYNKELRNMKEQINVAGNISNDIGKQLNDTNTKMLVAIARLSEKVENLERFLRDDNHDHR